MTRISAIGLGLITVALFAYGVLGRDTGWAIPDPNLTPGAVRTTSSEEVCAPGYDKAHRVWHDKAATLAKYGHSEAQRWLFEDDDLVPVCLGGDNADPNNHWDEACSRWEGTRCVAGDAYHKDLEEAASCRTVCYTLRTQGASRADRVLRALQHQFMTDWREIHMTGRD